MAISKEKKQEILETLKDALSNNESTVFVNFHGLSVEDAARMRHALREEGVGYTVAKKTLTRRALEHVQAEGDMPAFPGELAVAYGSETAPARGIYTFQKELDGAVTIVGGIFEGKYLDQEAMTEIAQIPSLQVLRGMFVNLINSPIQGLAVVLNQVAEKKS